MPTSRLLRVCPLVAAVALLAPRTIRAQESVAWTVCYPLESCESVQLATSPVFSGTDRIGTNVTIDIHNLNGQVVGDATPWWELDAVQFYGPGNFTGTEFGSGPLALSGGAVGSATWNYSVSSGDGRETIAAGAPIPDDDGFAQMLAGCASGNRTAVNTCGPQALATLSFTSGQIFDAESFDGLFVQAADQQYGEENYIPFNRGCTAGSVSAPWWPACNVITHTVTPEPVTMVLLGTGLLGIGGVRLRRRKHPLG